MKAHDLWHVFLLVTALGAAAGAALVLLGPIVFDRTPAGLARARPVVFALVTAGAILILLEWLGVHGRSL